MCSETCISYEARLIVFYKIVHGLVEIPLPLKAVLKQLKPCLNNGIHVLFEHGFYLKILKTAVDCLRDVKGQYKAAPE